MAPAKSQILQFLLYLLILMPQGLSSGDSSVYSSILSNQRALTVDTDTRIYIAKLQTNLDERFNITLYFTNKRIIRHFVRCLFYGEICDIVGRWAKPRMLQSMLGGCIRCTKYQKTWSNKALEIISIKFPEMYRALLGRFLEYMGIVIPPKERQLVKISFEQSELVKNIQKD